MTRPTYHVANGHTLGYVDPAEPQLFCVLAGKPQLGGYDWKNGPVSTFGLDLQKATFEDFLRFRVSPKGQIE